MDTGGRIKEKRKEKGLTQAGLAALIGVDKSTVYRWEAGKQAPESGTAVSLAEALGTTSDYLLGKTPASEKWSQGPGADSMIKSSGCAIEDEDDPSLRSCGHPETDTISVPVISPKTKICGGEGNGLAEVEFEVLYMMPIPRRYLGGHFYDEKSLRLMTVEGDSMEPKIHDGDQVLYSMGEEIPDGRVAVVSLRGRWLVRGILYGRDRSVTLHAVNPQYRDIPIEPGADDFRIIGLVIASISSRPVFGVL